MIIHGLNLCLNEHDYIIMWYYEQCYHDYAFITMICFGKLIVIECV
jgi:hypothetical protein